MHTHHPSTGLLNYGIAHHNTVSYQSQSEHTNNTPSPPYYLTPLTFSSLEIEDEEVGGTSMSVLYPESARDLKLELENGIACMACSLGQGS